MVKYLEVKNTPKQKFLTKNKGMRKVHGKPTNKISFANTGSKLHSNLANKTADALFGLMFDE